jgi:hypothetical protein
LIEGMGSRLQKASAAVVLSERLQVVVRRCTQSSPQALHADVCRK